MDALSNMSQDMVCIDLNDSASQRADHHPGRQRLQVRRDADADLSLPRAVRSITSAVQPVIC